MVIDQWVSNLGGDQNHLEGLLDQRPGPGSSDLVSLRPESLPTMPETWVRALGRDDPVEKEMATHFNILA